MLSPAREEMAVVKLVDEDVLDCFCGPGYCEVCRQWCRNREPHHLLSRGMGGAGRIDHPWNLLAVGSSAGFGECPCHRRIHDGRISRDDLWDIVSVREWMLVDELKAEIRRLQGQTKEERRKERGRGGGSEIMTQETSA